jgi:hypothetical protein
MKIHKLNLKNSLGCLLLVAGVGLMPTVYAQECDTFDVPLSKVGDAFKACKPDYPGKSIDDKLERKKCVLQYWRDDRVFVLQDQLRDAGIEVERRYIVGDAFRACKPDYPGKKPKQVLKRRTCIVKYWRAITFEFQDQLRDAGLAKPCGTDGSTDYDPAGGTHPPMDCPPPDMPGHEECMGGTHPPMDCPPSDMPGHEECMGGMHPPMDCPPPDMPGHEECMGGTHPPMDCPPPDMPGHEECMGGTHPAMDCPPPDMPGHEECMEGMKSPMEDGAFLTEEYKETFSAE